MSRDIPMPTANAYRVEHRGAWIYYGPQLNARWMSLYTIELLIRQAITSPDETAAWHPDRAQRPIIVPLAILEDASNAVRTGS